MEKRKAKTTEPRPTVVELHDVVAEPTRPDLHKEIELLAYNIWLNRGRPEGTELENWVEAERQLRS